ncbi:MAG: DUF29 domain-containing protein [Cyanobacteria bacterium J06621_8]
MRTKWKDLAIASHYQTAVAIKQELMTGNTEAAKQGIEELIEALGRSEQRALKSQLIRLMMHVIKWKTQPEKRTASWVYTIESARMEIDDLLSDEPSLKPKLKKLFEQVFAKAKKLAEAEMSCKSNVDELTWQEVFTEEYSLAPKTNQ